MLIFVQTLVPVVFVDGPGLKEKEGALETGYTPVRTGSVGEGRPGSGWRLVPSSTRGCAATALTMPDLEVTFSKLSPGWWGSGGRENSGGMLASCRGV